MVSNVCFKLVFWDSYIVYKLKKKVISTFLFLNECKIRIPLNNCIYFLTVAIAERS